MALWTDIIDPATLTGYARAALRDYEVSKGTLARWLPNRLVADIVVRFVQGSYGLQDVASFRAYDAQIEIGRRPSGKRMTLELPALGQDIPVSEYEQLRARSDNVSDLAALTSIQSVTRMVAQAVSDRMEMQRGIVLDTGINTITQANFAAADDYGRLGTLRYTAPALWSVAATDGLGQLQTASDLYVDTNGGTPGAILMSTRVLRSMAKLDQFKTQLLNSASRPATEQNARDTVSSAGLPPIYIYDRRVSVAGVATKALPDDRFYMLPAPVAEDGWMDTQLGATFWGRTLTSTDAAWAIQPEDQPGIVAGTFKGEKPPMAVEVISDAIGSPVLANANLSMSVKVL